MSSAEMRDFGRGDRNAIAAQFSQTLAFAGGGPAAYPASTLLIALLFCTALLPRRVSVLALFAVNEPIESAARLGTLCSPWIAQSALNEAWFLETHLVTHFGSLASCWLFLLLRKVLRVPVLLDLSLVQPKTTFGALYGHPGLGISIGCRRALRLARFVHSPVNEPTWVG